jgi:hypothetical protein
MVAEVRITVTSERRIGASCLTAAETFGIADPCCSRAAVKVLRII